VTLGITLTILLFKNAILSVDKTASVTPIATNKNCDDSDPTFAGVLSGFNADNVMASYTRTTLKQIQGSYTISATLA
jgi:hypothetical protein